MSHIKINFMGFLYSGRPMINTHWEVRANTYYCFVLVWCVFSRKYHVSVLSDGDFCTNIHDRWDYEWSIQV